MKVKWRREKEECVKEGRRKGKRRKKTERSKQGENVLGKRKEEGGV